MSNDAPLVTLSVPTTQPAPTEPTLTTPAEPRSFTASTDADLNPWGTTSSPPDYTSSPPSTALPQPGCLVLLSPDDLSFIGALTADPSAPVPTFTSTAPTTASASSPFPTAMSTPTGLAIRVPAGLSPNGTTEPRTRSFDYRLSISDMSLHTLRRSNALPIPGRDHLGGEGLGASSTTTLFPSPSGAELGAAWGIGHTPARRSHRGSWTTDGEGSFYTARGTLRSVFGAHEGEGGEEGLSGDGEGEEGVEERDVLVAWMEQPTTPSTPPQQSRSLMDQFPGLTDSPIRDRVIHLFHPRTPAPATRTTGTASTGSGSDTASSGMSLGTSTSLVSFGGIQAEAEKAFWALVMPSISEVVRWTETIAGALSSAASYLPGASTSLVATETEFRPTPRLYEDETIWTLRFPSAALAMVSEAEGRSGERGIEGKVAENDLGPTARPVLVKKRAGLPKWEVKEREMGLGWGREGIEAWR